MEYSKPGLVALSGQTSQGGFCQSGSCPRDACDSGSGYSTGNCYGGAGAAGSKHCTTGYGADGWNSDYICHTGDSAHDQSGKNDGCHTGNNPGSKGYCSTGGSAGG
jgi:hypothetical protein